MSTLEAELCSLAAQWDRLKKPTVEGYTVRADTRVVLMGQDDTGESELEMESRISASCRNCDLCVFSTL